MEKSPGIRKNDDAEISDFEHSGSGESPCDHTNIEMSKEDLDRDSLTKFPIVGIVASAGGLDAFKKFFTAMPSDSGMAFVLIPHLDPSHKSMMVELLSELTSMPVVEAKHDVKVLVNNIYVIPPNHFLSISHGQLQLCEPQKDYAWKTSIDFFLRSLAQDLGEKSIGIVLSGTGSHGTLGVREIKLSGGMVMAQKPESAEFAQMPQSAIAGGVVDYILPPDQMPAALIKYIGQPYLSASDVKVTAEQSKDLLNPILVVLQSRTKYDFRQYRKPMVLRRIQRRMGLSHIERMENYLDFLQQPPDEVTALYKDLLISVTAFFRDQEAFHVLEKEIIPALIAGHKSDLPIRVWVPGCATGEEAYSIAMLLFEGIAAAQSSLTIQVFASDIDADAIEVARTGIYPACVASDVSPGRLEQFFVILDEHHYQINKKLRESVVYSNQNLIRDAPFSKIDLLSCRNLLIYLEPEMQKNVIALFHFALVSDGYLFLGPSESIGRSGDLFETLSKKWRVFRRIESSRRNLVSFPSGRSTEPTNASSNASSSFASLILNRKSFKELTEKLILNDYAPAAALCNRSLEVLYVTGPLVNYLEFPRGEITKDLLTMARPGLRTKLRATCRNAACGGKTVIETNAKVNRNGKNVRCSITVRPMTESKETEGLLLIMFQDQVATNDLQTSSNTKMVSSELEIEQTEDSRLAQQLEIELKSMSEELHSTIEEMESSNEKLKTSNEEIMSMNEELQSVNEELETSKEELQSLNEELSTVNSQLQEKVIDLKAATDDLMNLMSSTEIATIFLDEELNIKRFTPPTKSLLNLLNTDIGRPLKDISPKFADDTMLFECKEVLSKLAPLEREVETDEPRHYLRRILPYRTTDHDIGGVVITFVDLTQRKKAEAVQRETDTRHFAELHESAERMQAILNTAADAIVTVNLQGRIDSINLATERLFGYGRDELIGQNISMLIPAMSLSTPDENENKKLAIELVKTLEDRREVLAQRKDRTTFPIDLALSRVDHLGLYTGILRDISVRKQLQTHVLEIATDEQRRIGQDLHDGTQQELTGLSLFAGAVCDFLDKATSTQKNGSVKWMLIENDYKQLKKTAIKLTQGLIEANRHVQILSHGIMPVQIDAEGLRSALAELAASTNEQQTIRCQFAFSGSAAISNNSIATQLFRIAQESLNNAIKHGMANDILISLSQEAERIVLEVCDNGVGFESLPGLHGPAIGNGKGLRIMEYRASILGGSLEINRNNGKQQNELQGFDRGTTVRCTIPVTSGLT